MPLRLTVQVSPDIEIDNGPLLFFDATIGLLLLPSPVLAAGTGVVEGFGVVDGVGVGVGVGVVLCEGGVLVLGLLLDDELLPSVKTIALPSDEVEKA